MVVWFAETPMQTGRQYLVKHTALETPGEVVELRYRIQVGTLRSEPATALQMNEIGRIRLETARPLAADAYAQNRTTGSFILIDRMTNATVGAGMVVERMTAEESAGRTHAAAADAGRNLRLVDKRRVTADARAVRLGQRPFVLWITGLPRSGKSSLAYALEERLFADGRHVQVLDGEILRRGLSRDLGFRGADRWENQRRAAEVARLNAESGLITIVALVSPLAAERQQARAIVGADRFVEVFCDAPLAVCEARDQDGLYARARAGEIANVTGVDAPYEAPTAPEVRVDTEREGLAANLDRVLAALRQRGMLG
jgi:bifunctional enzyme CysN/CysC